MSCSTRQSRPSTEVTERLRTRSPVECWPWTVPTPTPRNLLAAPDSPGEIRRLTTLFADLVDSTALSTRMSNQRFTAPLLDGIATRYVGASNATKATSARPRAMGCSRSSVTPQPTRTMSAAQFRQASTSPATWRISANVCVSRFGFDISVRVGIHRGIVYLDTAQDDVYGFAANLTARLCGLADPGAVAVSDAVEQLVRSGFELEARLPKPVKGVEGLIRYFQVIARARYRGFDARPARRSPARNGVPEELVGLRHRWASLRKPGVVTRGRSRNWQEPAWLGGCRPGRALARHGAAAHRVAVPHRRRVAARTSPPGAAVRHHPCLGSRQNDCDTWKREVSERRMDARDSCPAAGARARHRAPPRLSTCAAGGPCAVRRRSAARFTTT